MLDLHFDPFPVLVTERLVLRKLRESDTKEILVQRSHPEIQRYIKREPAKNEQDALDFIRRVTNNETLGIGVTWAFVPKGTEELIGQACFWNIEKEKDKAELGYSLHPDHFKKGIMSEALKVIIAYGFEKIHLKQIDAFTHKDNLASRTLLEKLGFVRNTAFESSYEDREEMEYNTIYTLLKS